MSALIGALRVSLSADTANFEKGMKRAESVTASSASGITRTLGSLKGAIAGFTAALTVGAFIQAGKQALEYASHLTELAETLGVTSHDLQTFSYAAGQVGISQEDLQRGLQKLTVSIGQAQLGAEKQIKAFQALGITVDELKGKNSGQIFQAMADKLQTVTDRSQRAAVEVAIFGKAGAKLDNLLSGAEGKLSDLAAAAEELGIVLSNEQIANADRTADKLAALKNVLSANIASAVADNADAIYLLANALIKLVSIIPQAIKGWGLFISYFNAAGGAIAHDIGSGFHGGTFVNPLTAMKDAAAARNNASLAARFSGDRAAMLASKSAGVNLPDFLAPKGGGAKKAKEDHTAEKILRENYQFNQDLNRAQQDVLQAQQDLSTDYVERTTLSIKIKNKEKEAYEAELNYNVALNKLTEGKEGMTETQADQLRTQFNIKDSLERQKILQDETEQRQKDVQDLTQKDFERKKDVLDSQAQLAETASERRKVELQILELAYEQKRQALQDIIDHGKDDAAKENARRDLNNLNKTFANDRQGVIKGTRGPLEEWAASIPDTADKINEALQSIEVEGLDGLVDAITEVIGGTKKLKDAFGDLAKSVVSDILKMSLKMLVFRGLTAIFGGSIPAPGGSINVTNTSLPGFAGGGGFTIGGLGGTDRNVLSINGIPMSRVSHGERVNITRDGANDGGATIINQHFAPNFAGNAATKQDLITMGQITKEQTIAALKDRSRRMP